MWTEESEVVFSTIPITWLYSTSILIHGPSPSPFKRVLVGVPLDYGVDAWVKEALYNVGTHS